MATEQEGGTDVGDMLNDLRTSFTLQTFEPGETMVEAGSIRFITSVNAAIRPVRRVRGVRGAWSAANCACFISCTRPYEYSS